MRAECGWEVRNWKLGKEEEEPSSGGKDGKDFSLKEEEEYFEFSGWPGILGETEGKLGPIGGGIVEEGLRA